MTLTNNEENLRYLWLELLVRHESYMTISAAAAGLIGAAIGASGTILASWIQKTRDIGWQKAQREQQGIEDLGRALAKLGQHYVDLGENAGTREYAARQHSLGHGLRSEVAMLTKFYAPELQQDRDEIDEQIRELMGEIQRSLHEFGQATVSEDGSRKVSPEEIRRVLSLPSRGAAVRDRCHEMMDELAKLRRKRADRAS